VTGVLPHDSGNCRGPIAVRAALLPESKSAPLDETRII